MTSPTAGAGMRPTTQPRRRARTRWRAMTLFAAAGLMLAAGCSSSASSSGTNAAGVQRVTRYRVDRQRVS